MCNIGFMSEKECTKCGEVKAFSEYSKNSRNKNTGLQPKCKSCNSLYHSENRDDRNKRMNKYYHKNADYLSIKGKEYYNENKEEILQKCKDYRIKNKKRLKEYFKTYKQKNLRKINEGAKLRKKEDPSFRIKCNLRSRLSVVLKGSKKSSTTEKLLGCSYEYARQHIESQFTEGMTWDNYGLHGWHIDHIMPCASFDLSDPEQQRECFHYTNLQPLWAEDNLKKSDKILNQ